MKVDVSVLGSPSLINLMVSVDVKHHVYLPKKTVWFLWNIDLEPALRSGAGYIKLSVLGFFPVAHTPSLNSST